MKGMKPLLLMHMAPLLRSMMSMMPRLMLMVLLLWLRNMRNMTMKLQMQLQMPMVHLLLRSMVPQLMKPVVTMTRQPAMTTMMTTVVMEVMLLLTMLMVPHQSLSMVLLLLKTAMVLHPLRNMRLPLKHLNMNMKMSLRMPMKPPQLQQTPMRLVGVDVGALEILAGPLPENRAPVLVVEGPSEIPVRHLEGQHQHPEDLLLSQRNLVQEETNSRGDQDPSSKSRGGAVDLSPSLSPTEDPEGMLLPSVTMHEKLPGPWPGLARCD